MLTVAVFAAQIVTDRDKRLETAYLLRLKRHEIFVGYAVRFRVFYRPVERDVGFFIARILVRQYPDNGVMSDAHGPQTFEQFVTAPPTFRPTTPPTAESPLTLPVLQQFVTAPSAFRPTTPPTYLLPLTLPVLQQFVTEP